jgi:hypothetical protein
MNGADLLCDELLTNNVDVCFANPGTSGATNQLDNWHVRAAVVSSSS